MRLLLLSLTFTFFHLCSEAQLFDRGQVWLHTDTIPSDNQLLGRHALLYFQVNIESKGLLDLQDEVDELSSSYPWLSIVYLHLPTTPSQCEPELISRHMDRLGLRSAVLVDTLRSALTPRAGVDQILVSLITPEGDAAMTDIPWSSNAYEKVIQELENIKSSHVGPGRGLSESYLTSYRNKLRDLLVLSYPTHLLHDHSQDRLIISDTGHDRVIICTDEGRILECIGSGIKGSDMGEFDMARLDRPMGIAYLPEADRLYIADHGNGRILIAEVGSRMLSEFSIKDEDGYPIILPASPTELSLSENLLTITMPKVSRVWTVDALSGNLINEYGQNGQTALFHKKADKLVLGNPIAAISIDDHVYIYDAQLRTVLDIADGRVDPVWSMDSMLVSKNGGAYWKDQVGILGMEFNEDFLYLQSDASDDLIRIDLEHMVADNYHWNVDSIPCGMLTDMDWHKDKTFILDSENGGVIYIEHEVTDHVRWSDLFRLYDGNLSMKNLIPMDPISIDGSRQTTLQIELDFPERYILHPMHPSSIFISAGSEVYLTESELADGNIEVIIPAGFGKNQVNLMGEIYFTEIGTPWKVYKRFIQLMIPIEESPTPSSNHLLNFDPLLGVSLSD